MMGLQHVTEVTQIDSENLFISGKNSCKRTVKFVEEHRDRNCFQPQTGIDPQIFRFVKSRTSTLININDGCFLLNGDTVVTCALTLRHGLLGQLMEWSHL